mmetsp:Transcript_7822/g.26580  ORF Transcript_7822/g.26580 Transcript_7822/m.26580 type:complete len:209 (+) Transcript_7822:561-1187(+)
MRATKSTSECARRGRVRDVVTERSIAYALRAAASMTRPTTSMATATRAWPRRASRSASSSFSSMIAGFHRRCPSASRDVCAPVGVSVSGTPVDTDTELWEALRWRDSERRLTRRGGLRPLAAPRTRGSRGRMRLVCGCSVVVATTSWYTSWRSLITSLAFTVPGLHRKRCVTPRKSILTSSAVLKWSRVKGRMVITAITSYGRISPWR